MFQRFHGGNATLCRWHGGRRNVHGAELSGEMQTEDAL
jgi:hypothetical protein